LILGFAFESNNWYPGFRATAFTANDVRRWRRLARHKWEKEEETRDPNAKMRDAIKGWLTNSSLVTKSRAIWSRRHSDPVPLTKDWSLLVEIVNSCVSYGAFQFTEVDVQRLCNVQIC
jgi:hypothetical protein